MEEEERGKGREERGRGGSEGEGEHNEMRGSMQGGSSHLDRASQVVKEVHGQLLVAAGVQHSRGAGKLEKAVHHTLVLGSRALERLPHLGSLVLVAGHIGAVLCSTGEGNEVTEWRVTTGAL